VTADLPQRLELENSIRKLLVSLDTQIFLTPPELTAYRSSVLQEFSQVNFPDFELVPGPTPREGQQQAEVIRFTFTHEGDQRTWEGEAFIAVSGRLGFVFTAASRQVLFSQYEPTVDNLFNSLMLPDSGFVPPSPEVAYSTLATGISPVTQLPTGTEITFERSVPRVVSYVEFRHIPTDSHVVWTWARVDPSGALIETIAVIGPLVAGGSKSIWVWIEPEGTLKPGFYVTVVMVNDEPLVMSPFTLVLKHGEEFSDLQSYLDWADFLTNIEEYETAVYAATEAIALDPALETAYRKRVVAYFGMCDAPSALDDLTKMTELLPDDRVPYFARAKVRWVTLDSESALADIDQAIHADSQFADSYNLRALINVTLGDFEQAVIDANRGVDLGPANSANLDTRAYTYLKAGDYDSARIDYEQLLDNGIDDAITLLGAGLAYFRLGDSTKSAELLEIGLGKASEIPCPDLPDPQLVDLTMLAEQAMENLAK